jgi:hypothetical protein
MDPRNGATLAILKESANNPRGQVLAHTGEHQRKGRESMKKLAVLLSLVCGLAASAFVLTPAAGAVTGINGVCSFPISIDQVLHGNPTDASHFPTSGPFTQGFFTGQVFVTITNDLNGNSIEVNISGPGFNTVDGGFILSGVSLLLLRSSATGDVVGPGLFLTHGPVLLTFTDHLNAELLSGGTVSGDLCGLIA